MCTLFGAARQNRPNVVQICTTLRCGEADRLDLVQICTRSPAMTVSGQPPDPLKRPAGASPATVPAAGASRAECPVCRGAPAHAPSRQRPGQPPRLRQYTAARARRPDHIASSALSGSCQSISGRPFSRKYRFARENGRLPKKPRYADNGLGWGERIR